jgi:hypothetical protein
MALSHKHVGSKIPAKINTYTRGFTKFGIAETANRADSGQLQFWSEPSEILNVRSSNTPETVAFTIS